MMATSPVLRLMRPTHWTKNLAVFAGVVFGGRLGEPWAILIDAAAFVILSAASSAIYILNDLADVEYDRAHPRKRHRPIASGEVTPATARSVATVLGGGALLSSLALGATTFWCVFAYVALNLLYSIRLKHIVLVDVICIALGFALRVLIGIYALGDLPTAWIVLCGFFLALFLGFGKRRAEVGESGTESSSRPVLERYDTSVLDSLLDGSATMAILAYSLFTATSGKNPSLVVTVPIVYFAITHYRRLLSTSGHGADPVEILLGDRLIQGCLVLWLLVFVAISYGELHFFR